MSKRNTFAHAMHDLGLAAWFGGSLMGAIGVNGAAGDVDDPQQRARVASAGWARWTPVNLAAIGAHLTGGALLRKERTGRQQSANGHTTAVLTVGALAATAYARILGGKLMKAGDVPVSGATAPSEATPPEIAKAQKQLAALQWAIPGLTGAMLASSSLHEEPQTPGQVVGDLVKSLPSTVGRGASSLGATVGPVVTSAASTAASSVSAAAKDAAARVRAV